MTQPSLDFLKSEFLLFLDKSQHRLAMPSGFYSPSLNSAINYALSSPGKRLRPLLVLAAALSQDNSDFKRSLKLAMPAALAVEYVHTYSLIHDDLPAMDDDDFRRNKPSLHRQFNDGLAILAGDALLADAFYFLSTGRLNTAFMCQELALAAGRYGLTAGQAEDLALGQKSLNVGNCLAINQAKTARLFAACAVLGALSVGCSPKNLSSWRRLGQHFGTAFQLKDDLADQEGMLLHMSEEELSKNLLAELEHIKKYAQLLSANNILFELIHSTFAS